MSEAPMPRDDFEKVGSQSRDFIRSDGSWFLQSYSQMRMGFGEEAALLGMCAVAIQLWEVHRQDYDVDEAKGRKDDDSA